MLTKTPELAVRVLEYSPVEIFFLDPKTFKFVDTGMKAFDHLGYDRESIYTLRPEDIFRGIRSEVFYKLVEPLNEQTWGELCVETEIRKKDGSVYPAEIRIRFMHDVDPPVFLITALDITDRKALLKALDSGRRDLDEIERIAHLGSWIWDIRGGVLTWSDEVYRIFGLRPQEIEATYEAFLGKIHPDDRKHVEKAVNEALSYKSSYQVEHRIVLSEGSERIVFEQGKVTYDENGKAERMVGTVQDITERKRIEEELKRLSTAIEESINLVYITDSYGQIVYVNPMFEKTTGYSETEAIGKRPGILGSGNTTRREYKELWDTITAGKTWRGDFKNKKKNGEYFWARGLISPIRNDRDVITHYLAIQEDITEKVDAEAKAAYLANHDSTTGLLNRERFLLILEQQLNGGSGTVILLDIDGFKLFNEAFSHVLADQFLKGVGGIVRNVMGGMEKEGDFFIGRFGEDEIAVIIAGKTERSGYQAAEKIRSSVAEFHLQDAQAAATLSAGVIEYPAHGDSVGVLLRRLDAAVNKAKELGRNQCHVYDPSIAYIDNIQLQVVQKNIILKALADKRFDPWFQPILNLSENKVHHYESLARMRTENQEITQPGHFVPAAEQLGLISDIDKMIASKTIQYQARLFEQGKSYSFAMNLSGKNIGDDRMLQFLQECILEYGSDPSRLVFEITETQAVEDLDRAIRFIKALKSLGCRFSLDDFGVGFTSFVYLREMNVDYIKIDGSFIRRIHEHPHDRGIVRAMTTVAREMNILTIAEFVENKKILDVLIELGVDYAQGYYIGKPVQNID